jgi:RNA polymerase sigma-70 factor (ECF subfamily)
MPVDTRTDEELLAVTEHDPAAFGVFFERHARSVLTFFRRRTGNPETAADLMAETFAAALIAAPRYEPREAATSWLFSIARYKLIDSRRRGRVEDAARLELQMQPLYLDDQDLDQIEAIASSGESLELIAGLPEDQRAAIQARVVEERGYPEIAHELGCSEAVVRKRVSRGLRTLRVGLDASDD